MNFLLKFQIIFFSLILLSVTTIQNSYAQVVAPLGQPVPEGPVQVTPEEFNELKKQEIKHPTAKPLDALNPSDPSDPFANTISATARSVVPFGQGQGAIFVFAFIGTILVVAWIPYVAYLTYRKIKYPEKYDLKNLASAQVTYIEDTKRVNQKRKGVMSSVRYSPLLSKVKSIEQKNNGARFYFGFNFELGHFDFYDQNRMTFEKQHYHSPYWMVGPSFIFGDLEEEDVGLFSKIDLTAGTSFQQDVDLILKGELSINLLFDKIFFAGVGGTLLYLYGREGKGIVSNINKSSLQGFVNFGIVF